MTDEVEVYKFQAFRKDMAQAGMFKDVQLEEEKECPFCKRKSKTVTRRPLNTMYHNEEQNFQESCDDCYQETIEYYSDLWSEYYSSVM